MHQPQDLRITRGDRGAVYVLVKDTPGQSPDYWAAPHESAAAAAPPPPPPPVVEPSAVIEGDGGASGAGSGSAGAAPANGAAQ